MFEEFFLPVKIQGLHNHPIDWNSSSTFPHEGKIKLMIFGVTNRQTDYTYFPICRAMRDLVWNVSSNNKIAHLGIFVDNNHGTALSKLIRFLIKKYPEVRFLIYGLDGHETALNSSTDLFTRSTFFMPGIQSQNFPLIPEIISSRKFDRIIFAGLQQYLVSPDYQKLASYPEVDIWYLRNTDPSRTESIVRDAYTVWVDYHVLARGVTGSEHLPHPAGLTMQQWAAMFYYTGLSPVNRVMILSHTNPADLTSADAETLAVGIWHYYEGLKNKMNDYPFIPIQNLIKKEVYMHDFRTYVYNNPETKRWWIAIPGTNGSEHLLPIPEQTARSVIQSKDVDELLKYW